MRTERRATEVFVVACTLAIAASAACAGARLADEGGEDAGSSDLRPTEALCPVASGSACARASDCGSGDERPPSNCAGCVPYNAALCASAACITPARLGSGDIHQLRFQVGSELAVRSFASVVLADTTSGGSTIRCEDVYTHRIDPSEPCYNVVDSRGRAAISQPGDVYQIDFSGFAGVDRALFLVFGYALEGAEGKPVGVSCTEVEVSEPGRGARLVLGDRMRRLD